MNYFCPDLVKHSTLVNDKLRNEFYKDAIDKSVKDKVVLDMGSGTGLLSFMLLMPEQSLFMLLKQIQLVV